MFWPRGRFLVPRRDPKIFEAGGLFRPFPSVTRGGDSLDSLVLCGSLVVRQGEEERGKGNADFAEVAGIRWFEFG